MQIIKRIFILALSIMMISACGTIEESSETVPKELIEIFDYELQNRAFARGYFEELLVNDKENPAYSFFEAYYEMEMITQKKYAPYASKYNLETEARWWTRARMRLGMIMGDWFQDSFMKMMHKATIKYVEKLKKLEQLSPAEDLEFFRYVINQEQAQLDAVTHMVNGDMDKAVATINDFVAANR